MDRMIRAATLTGFVVFAAATAHAQSLYSNYGIFDGLNPATAPFQARTGSYSGFYMGSDGSLHSSTVNAFSMNLGSGASVGVFTEIPNAAGLNFSGLGGNFAQNLPGNVPTNLLNQPYFDPAGSGRANVAGQLSIGLGGGLSMNLLGGVSRGPSGGFYFGPRSAFDSRTFTTAGAGFSLDLGHGGTLSLTGSVSSGPRTYGYGFP